MANQYKKLDFTTKEGRHTLARMMAEEGIVLLENRNAVLPLGREKVALFGRTQIDTIKGGTGSANSTGEYSVSIQDGLRDAGVNLDEELALTYREWADANPIPSFGVWGSGMHSNPEMPIDLAIAKAAKRRGAKKAIVVIGRTAGENEDTGLVKGDYYPLVELGDLGQLDEMKAIGLFEHSGVANHPGDEEMKKIAERIAKELLPLLR